MERVTLPDLGAFGNLEISRPSWERHTIALTCNGSRQSHKWHSVNCRSRKFERLTLFKFSLKDESRKFFKKVIPSLFLQNVLELK